MNLRDSVQQGYIWSVSAFVVTLALYGIWEGAARGFFAGVLVWAVFFGMTRKAAD
jgi:hypothetical protein